MSDESFGRLGALALLLLGAAGRTLMRGLAQPSTEMVWAFFAPRVVFVLALLCVAKLCFVACVCDCTEFCFRLTGLLFRLSLCELHLWITFVLN
jgi:hypothetical protein